jgi:hypothetical protein
VTDSPQAVPYELDVGSVVVWAGGSCNITVQPREAFRPSRLKILAKVAEGFTVNFVSVTGSHEVLLFKGPRAASDFAGAGRELDAARLVGVSNFVTVSVTNNTPGDLVFRATVTGSLAT